jgi:hypothetical protein
MEARMHTTRNHKWAIGLVVGLVLLSTLACSFSDLVGATPEIREVEVTRIVEPPGPPIDLAGVWRNPVTNTIVFIAWEDNEFRVIYLIDTDDGEVYPLTTTDWNGTRIHWSYYVPSTTYNVTYTMTSLSGDSLNTDWFNDHDMSGTRTWQRE